MSNLIYNDQLFLNTDTNRISRGFSINTTNHTLLQIFCHSRVFLYCDYTSALLFCLFNHWIIELFYMIWRWPSCGTNVYSSQTYQFCITELKRKGFRFETLPVFHWGRASVCTHKVRQTDSQDRLGEGRQLLQLAGVFGLCSSCIRALQAEHQASRAHKRNLEKTWLLVFKKIQTKTKHDWGELRTCWWKND